ncbi:inner membrane protein [Klebsiella variicola]|uniref:Inner membrane protein n=1 Tax=Klebsiella variicola TaxID=244366 RepID=A0A7H4MEA0_KLEVA|nr:inner membrane protein [Klebsiella variicola]
MKLTDKIRRDWHYYAVALGLIFILNGVVGLLGLKHRAGNPTPSVWSPGSLASGPRAW